MYIPSHLRYYASKNFQNSKKKIVLKEFSSLFKDFGKNIDDLNKLEKALIFKIGFIFHVYINDRNCRKCSAPTSQFRFLACIAAMEALLGNAKKEKRKISNGKRKSVPKPLIVTFLLNNLSNADKQELLDNIVIYRGTKERIIKNSFSKLKTLVDMRDGFMHRAELIRIDEGSVLSIGRGHRGRRSGVRDIKITMTRFSEMVKITIVRYLTTADAKRKPQMNHSIIS